LAGNKQLDGFDRSYYTRKVEDNIVRAAKFTAGAAAGGAMSLLGDHQASEEDPFWQGFRKKAQGLQIPQGPPGAIKNIPAPNPMKAPKPALSPMPSVGDVSQGTPTQLVAGQ